MNWVTVANLIVTVGLPATEKIIANWANKTPVTLAEFADVREVAQQSAAARVRAQLEKANIPLDSDTAKLLLGLAE